MRILCTNYEYPPIGGGGGAACKGLVEALAGLGHEVDVLTSGMKDLAPYEKLGSVGLHRVPCYRRHRHYTTIPEMVTQVLPAYRKGLQLLRSRPYNINHTHFILPTGVTSYLLWRRTGLPYVITVHGSDVPGYNPDRFRLAHRLLHPMWREIVRGATCIITASHFLAELIRACIDVTVEVIPYGIDFPPMPDQPKRNRILVVTRMFERKGVQFFLKALERLRSDWEICIAGDGPYLSQLQRLSCEIRTPVKFLGFVQGEKLWDLYQSARILVFPSIQENFPVVLLEAMHAGCAVITTSASGCAEVVRDAAIKVKPASVEELHEAMQRLVGDENEIHRLARLGRARVAECSSDAVARTHEVVFTRWVQ